MSLGIRLSAVPTEEELQAIAAVLPDFTLAEQNGDVLLTFQRLEILQDSVPLATFRIRAHVPQGFAHPLGWKTISYFAQTLLNLRVSLQHESEAWEPSAQVFEMLNGPVFGTADMLLQGGELSIELEDVHSADPADWFGF